MPFPLKHNHIDPKWCIRSSNALGGIAKSILQADNRTPGNMIVDVIIAKAGAATSISGITGLIATFGAASTGTAIASLSGAAAASAKLFWIGSIVGSGVVVGGWILTALAVIAGIFGYRKWVGKPRTCDTLTEIEKQLLKTIELLAPALRAEAVIGRVLEHEELHALRTFFDEVINKLGEYQKSEAKSNIAPKHRVRLWFEVAKLKYLRKALPR